MYIQDEYNVILTENVSHGDWPGDVDVWIVNVGKHFAENVLSVNTESSEHLGGLFPNQGILEWGSQGASEAWQARHDKLAEQEAS